jgi:ABC-type Zn uptake system ZnuABC Zn-binding protein ZnuA
VRALRTSALLLAGALAAGACGGDGAAGGQASGEQLVVVTTVSPITSIAAAVIGDLAEIRGVVPEGTNSHTFEPTPSVSEALAGADVVFANGLQLEEPTLELARDVAAGAEIVELGDLIVSPEEYRYDFSFPKDGGRPNPHLWTDPTLAKGYARHIADTMAEVDPGHADEYRTNEVRFGERVDEFDDALRRALDTVPADDRKLLTYHDAYAYWAETYGWTVVGAVQPADFGEPSPKDVADLIEQVRAEGVPAIFGSEVFPSPVLEQIAAETDAAYVDDLRDDDLPGEPGDEEHSYLGLLRANYVTIVDALGGDPTALEEFRLRTSVPDQASYPQ